MKKIIMFFLMAIISIRAIADTETVNGIEWNYEITNGNAEITSVSFDETQGDIIIPSTLGGSSVTSIGEGAFYYCDNLTSITIPDSVTSIGNWTFEYCYNLESITLPNNLTNIGYGAFYECSSLTGITIPDSVTSIGESAFEYCYNLESITLSKNLTSISYRAFWGCSSLTSITIPDKVTEIGEAAFSGCSSLTGFVVSADNPNYKSVNGLLLSKDGKNLLFGINADVIIPDSVTNIYDDAFYGCDSLESIIIPDGVTSIGVWAFGNCSSLTSITIPASVINIGDVAFSYCSSLTEFVVSADNPNYKSVNGLLLSKDGKNLLFGINSDVIIPAGVTSIGDWAFRGCYVLTSITIPNSVTSIGKGAFSGCSSLTSITIPNGVTEILDDTFSYCGNLTSVTIPDNVTSIGDWTFEDCYCLESIKLPDNLISIGRGAFSYCSSLTSITIPDSVTSIGGGAFRSCSELNYDTTTIQGVRLVDGWVLDYTEDCPAELNLTSVRGICDSAFEYCYNLESITLPNNLARIGDWTFSYCSSLTSITIPDTVTSIGDWAFGPCYSLKEVIFLGDAPLTVGEDAFSELAVDFVIKVRKGSKGWNGDYTSAELPERWNGYPIVYCEEYKVVFNANGGTGTMSDQAFIKDIEQALSLNTFTLDGYVLSGWSTSPEGDVAYSNREVVKNLTTETDGIVELYAVWTKSTLETALDTTNLVWETSSEYSWKPIVSTNAFDGVDYAISGTILDNTNSWIQTSVEGSGTISFAWNISCENRTDYAIVYVDGIQQYKITGETDWQQIKIDLGPGTHTIKWVYQKGRSGSAGLDALMLDCVSWVSTADEPITFDIALETQGLKWTTGGDANWIPARTVNSFDKEDCAISGKIADNQESYIETTVVGPGVISFVAKVSCEDGYDWFDFYVDGELYGSYTGETGWFTDTFEIGEGRHILSWVYWKDELDEEGMVNNDVVYLDSILWLSDNEIIPEPDEEPDDEPELTHTSTTEVSVPYTWLNAYPELMSRYAGDYEAAANSLAANGINKVWECYVAGLDPTDITAKFISIITFEGNSPIITWNPNVEGRIYTIEGTPTLNPLEWDTPTNETHRFFRVKVSLPQDEEGGDSGTTDKIIMILFDARGGSVSPDNIMCESNGVLGELPIPTFEGYDFVGWFDDINGGTEYTSTSPVPLEDMTLYAIWEAETYRVTFNANGGSGEMADQTFTYGVEQALSSNTFTRNGYVFAGWARSPNGDVLYTDGEVVNNLTSEPNGVVDLYAKWIEETYVIYTTRFNANGGEGTMSDQTFTYGVEQALAENTFTRGGYTFAGWATSQNGDVVYADGEVVNNLTTEPNGVVDLYAKWAPNTYEVCFFSNGGTGIMHDQSFVYGVPQPLSLNAFTREGYAFVGWSILEYSDQVDYKNCELVSNLSMRNHATVALYAVWSPIFENNPNGIQLWEDGPYWASKNIGAEKLEDYGLYFWWGDTVGHRPNESSFSFSFSFSNTSTYDKDNETLLSNEWISSNGVLVPKHDAARAHLGEKWRMPIDSELEGLYVNCTWTQVSVNGVEGYKVSGRGAYSDKSIFLPAAGYGNGTSLYGAGSGGGYWSSRSYSGFSDRSLGLDLIRIVAPQFRNNGYPIRPVVNKPYTVRFNANGGLGTMEDQTFSYGVEQALSSNLYYNVSCTFEGWATSADGEVVYADGEVVKNLTKEVDGVVELFAVWKLVDKVQLWEGGPYWATRNIGATNPEDYGLYFWWGDTVGHRPNGDSFSFSFNGSNTPTYGKTYSELKSEGWITSSGVLAPSHDAARAHWGSNWRMPTDDELQALVNNCTWIWTKVNGVEGYKVSGRGAYSDKSIFLPAAGGGGGTSLYDAGSYGRYWSSVPSSGYYYYYSWGLYFGSSYHDVYDNYRYFGYPVRPVSDVH